MELNGPVQLAPIMQRKMNQIAARRTAYDQILTEDKCGKFDSDYEGCVQNDECDWITSYRTCMPKNLSKGVGWFWNSQRAHNFLKRFGKSDFSLLQRAWNTGVVGPLEFAVSGLLQTAQAFLRPLVMLGGAPSSFMLASTLMLLALVSGMIGVPPSVIASSPKFGTVVTTAFQIGEQVIMGGIVSSVMSTMLTKASELVAELVPSSSRMLRRSVAWLMLVVAPVAYVFLTANVQQDNNLKSLARGQEVLKKMADEAIAAKRGLAEIQATYGSGPVPQHVSTRFEAFRVNLLKARELSLKLSEGTSVDSKQFMDFGKALQNYTLDSTPASIPFADLVEPLGRYMHQSLTFLVGKHGLAMLSTLLDWKRSGLESIVYAIKQVFSFVADVIADLLHKTGVTSGPLRSGNALLGIDYVDSVLASVTVGTWPTDVASSIAKVIGAQAAAKPT